MIALGLTTRGTAAVTSSFTRRSLDPLGRSKVGSLER